MVGAVMLHENASAVFWLFAYVLVFGGLGGIIGAERGGREIIGTLLGIFFGPFGLIAALSLRRKPYDQVILLEKVLDQLTANQKQIDELLQIIIDKNNSSSVISYKCPHCNTKLQVVESKSLDIVTCPKCSQKHRVPVC